MLTQWMPFAAAVIVLVTTMLMGSDHDPRSALTVASVIRAVPLT
jgi:hypothetical protein